MQDMLVLYVNVYLVFDFQLQDFKLFETLLLTSIMHYSLNKHPQCIYLVFFSFSSF